MRTRGFGVFNLPNKPGGALEKVLGKIYEAQQKPGEDIEAVLSRIAIPISDVKQMFRDKALSDSQLVEAQEPVSSKYVTGDEVLIVGEQQGGKVVKVYTKGGKTFYDIEISGTSGPRIVTYIEEQLTKESELVKVAQITEDRKGFLDTLYNEWEDWASVNSPMSIKRGYFSESDLKGDLQRFLMDKFGEVDEELLVDLFNLVKPDVMEASKRVAQKVGEEFIVEPGYYWFHESVPEVYGRSFEITMPTKFKVLEEREHTLLVENLEPINTEIKVFRPGEMKLYIYKVTGLPLKQAQKVWMKNLTEEKIERLKAAISGAPVGIYVQFFDDLKLYGLEEAATYTQSYAREGMVSQEIADRVKKVVDEIIGEVLGKKAQEEGAWANIGDEFLDNLIGNTFTVVDITEPSGFGWEQLTIRYIGRGEETISLADLIGWIREGRVEKVLGKKAQQELPKQGDTIYFSHRGKYYPGKVELAGEYSWGKQWEVSCTADIPEAGVEADQSGMVKEEQWEFVPGVGWTIDISWMPEKAQKGLSTKKAQKPAWGDNTIGQGGAGLVLLVSPKGETIDRININDYVDDEKLYEITYGDIARYDPMTEFIAWTWDKEGEPDYQGLTLEELAYEWAGGSPVGIKGQADLGPRTKKTQQFLEECYQKLVSGRTVPFADEDEFFNAALQVVDSERPGLNYDPFRATLDDETFAMVEELVDMAIAKGMIYAGRRRAQNLGPLDRAMIELYQRATPPIENVIEYLKTLPEGEMFDPTEYTIPKAVYQEIYEKYNGWEYPGAWFALIMNKGPEVVGQLTEERLGWVAALAAQWLHSDWFGRYAPKFGERWSESSLRSSVRGWMSERFGVPEPEEQVAEDLINYLKRALDVQAQIEEPLPDGVFELVKYIRDLGSCNMFDYNCVREAADMLLEMEDDHAPAEAVEWLWTNKSNYAKVLKSPRWKEAQIREEEEPKEPETEVQEEPKEPEKQIVSCLRCENFNEETQKCSLQEKEDIDNIIAFVLQNGCNLFESTEEYEEAPPEGEKMEEEKVVKQELPYKAQVGEQVLTEEQVEACVLGGCWGTWGQCEYYRGTMWSGQVIPLNAYNFDELGVPDDYWEDPKFGGTACAASEEVRKGITAELQLAIKAIRETVTPGLLDPDVLSEEWAQNRVLDIITEKHPSFSPSLVRQAIIHLFESWSFLRKPYFLTREKSLVASTELVSPAPEFPGLEEGLGGFTIQTGKSGRSTRVRSKGEGKPQS